MSKSYTLLLNSANTVNRSGAGTTSYSYYVNWQSVLPSSCKKFDVSYSLKSQMTATLQSNIILLSCNIGNQTTYDQTYSQTPIICAITPESNPATVPDVVQYYYQSLITDESGFMIGYPQNSNLEIKILNPTPTAGVYALAASFPHYVLQLTFTEIEEDE